MKKRTKKENTKEAPSRENINRALFWITTLILLAISFLIIRPYLISLITAFLLAFLIKPVHNKLNKYIDRKISALICILIIIILLLIPLSLITVKLLNQINYSQINEIVLPNEIISKIKSIPFLENLNLNSLKEKGLSLIVSMITTTVKYIPSIILSLIITFVGIYYILMYWEKITSELKFLLPFKDKNKIEKEISHTTTHIIHGYLLIAIIDFVIAMIGFYISGVELYLFFPFLIGVFAFIPLVGAGAVWIPLALYYLITGQYPIAIGVVITGLIVSNLIDQLLAAKIMQNKAKINPLIFIIGILGGVPLFGVFGIIIGPLILIYSIKFLSNAVNNR